MERTLFTPAMIETFRACRRAYQLAFLGSPGFSSHPVRLSTLCKRFLLKAIGEINRSRITTLQQVQKFLGQHWPTEKLAAANDARAQEKTIQAFRFVYRILLNYIAQPYKPAKAEVAAVALKMRARIPHSKAYLEDTFDLIYWHPEQKKLELVDFHLNPLKPFDPAWPPTALVVRHFLAQRLRVRWPFEHLVVTFCRLQPDGMVPVSVELDDAVMLLHWPELVATINEMKAEQDFAPQRSELCKRCNFLSECLAMGQQPHSKEPDGTTACKVVRSA